MIVSSHAPASTADLGLSDIASGMKEAGTASSEQRQRSSSLLWWHAPEKKGHSQCHGSAPTSATSSSFAPVPAAPSQKLQQPLRSDCAAAGRPVRSPSVGELVAAQKGEQRHSGASILERKDFSSRKLKDASPPSDTDSASRLVEILRKEVEKISQSLRRDITSEVQQVTEKIILSVLQVASPPSTGPRDLQLEHLRAQATRALEDAGEANQKIRSLRADADRWRAEAQEARAELDDLKKNPRQPTAASETASREVADLQEKVEKANARSTQMSALVEDLEGQLGQAHSALKEADRVVRDGREARGDSAKLQEQLDKAQAEEQRLVGLVHDLQKQLSQSRSASSTSPDSSDLGHISLVSNLQKQLDSVRNELLQEVEAHASAKQLLEKAEEDVQKLTASSASHEDHDHEEVEALREELETLRGESRELRLKLKYAHRDQADSGAAEAAGLRQELSRLQVEVQAANTKARIAEEEATKSQADLEKLRISFKEARADSKLLKKLADRSGESDFHEVEVARSEVKRMSRLYEDTRRQLEQSRAHGTASDSGCDTKEEIAKVRDELDKVRASFKETRADARRLRRDNEHLQEQLQKGSPAASTTSDAVQQELERLRDETEVARAEALEAKAEAKRYIREVSELQNQLDEANR